VLLYHLKTIVIIFIKVLIVIILFVVVDLVMDSIVVSLVFISSTALMLPSGTLVLVYHLNLYIYDYFYQSSGTHYVRRGGLCNNGFYCGFTFISLLYDFGSSYWNVGATLSFKPIYYYFYQSSGVRYSLRGGSSAYELICGFTCVLLSVAFSGNGWNSGAALSFKPIFFL